MNFWRRGVGFEWIFVIARSLELQALPYALNRPPRAAASFNIVLEATAGRRVCGVLDITAPPRLITVVGSFTHEGRVPDIESQTEDSGRSEPRLGLRGR